MYGTLISSVTVGAGGASSIDFTSIPQTPYTDLILVLSLRADNVVIRGQFNNDTGSNYNMRRLTGDGTAVASSFESANTYAYLGFTPYTADTASTFGNTSIYIPNYASTSTKSISTDSVTENNAAAARQSIHACSWVTSSALTSIKLFPSSGNWLQYSTAYLYGLTKGSGGATAA